MNVEVLASGAPRWIGSIGHDGERRDVFVWDAPSFEDFLSGLTLPCPRFILLLAADFSTTADRFAVAERLLDAGCVYLCTWGPNCEFMHDLMDEVVVMRGLASPANDSTVMTTWHDDMPLADAVEFALRAAEPDGDYATGCDAIALATISSFVSPVALEAAASAFLV